MTNCLATNPDGWLYFMEPEGLPMIKIGFSQLPVGRLTSMMAWSPVPLRLSAQYRGRYYDEMNLHDLFRADRSHSEWFRASDRLRALVDSVNETGDGPHIDWPETLGDISRFRQFREAQGMTVKEFAAVIDATPKQVEAWEKQKSLSGAVRIVNAFAERGVAVTVADLVEISKHQRETEAWLRARRSTRDAYMRGEAA